MVEFNPATTTARSGISNNVHGSSGVKLTPVDALVEVLESGNEVFPFRPVRCYRIELVGALTQEIGFASSSVDVVVARHDGHVLAGQLHLYRAKT
jgi:hypothetical protein